MEQNSARGLPVVSVTSEISANASFQNAAARSARPDSDPRPGTDSFATLVDSNTAASRSDNRAHDSAPSPRRSDDAPTASDNRSRDNAAFDRSGKAARNESSDRNAAAKTGNDKTRDNNARDDDKVDADTDTGDGTGTTTATTRRAKSKSDAPKSDTANSDGTSQIISGDASSVVDQTETAQGGTIAMTADGIAAAIPAATAPAPATSAAPATDQAATPLAIAAAAIAASASLAAETAPAGENTDSDTPATSSATTAPAETTAKPVPQGGVGDAVSARATSGDPSVAGGIAQAASVVAATPAATKSAVPLRSADVANKSAATAAEQPDTTDSTATAASATPGNDMIASAATPSAEAVAKPKAENATVDAVKAGPSGHSTAPTSAHANSDAHLAAANIGQTPANSLGTAVQAPAALPAQPLAHTATPVATSQLTATAATGAAVPVSGLAMEIAASARSGKTRFEIRLDPAELGRIDVRIDVDRHGQVTSHLTVERPETLSMLRQDASQLQRALDNAGLSTGNGGLQFSLRDQSSQGQNDGNQGNPNAHRIVVSEEDSVPAVVAGRSYGRMLGASGGIDIRV
jgi:flagellar hook-length control protein FliK